MVKSVAQGEGVGREPTGYFVAGESPDDLPHIIDAGLEHGEAYANRAALDGRLRVIFG